MQTLNAKATTYALVVVAVAFYVICALFRPLFPTWPMYDVTMWQAIFPGFSWTTIGLLVGLIWTVVYTALAALIFTSVYNFFVRRELRPTRELSGHPG